MNRPALRFPFADPPGPGEALPIAARLLPEVPALCAAAGTDAEAGYAAAPAP